MAKSPLFLPEMKKLIALYSPAPQSGKTTAANYLQCNHGFRRVGFADPVRQIAAHLITACSGLDDVSAWDYVARHKSLPIAQLPSAPTARHLCQVIGTELGRQCISQNFWVDVWARRVAGLLDSGARVVCDDMRFMNEAAAVRDLGGECWRITRPGCESSPDVLAHVSEGGLEGSSFDAHIHNAATLKWLEQSIENQLFTTP